MTSAPVPPSPPCPHRARSRWRVAERRYRSRRSPLKVEIRPRSFPRPVPRDPRRAAAPACRRRRASGRCLRIPSGLVSRPTARTLIWKCCPFGTGALPTCPAATCTFCSRKAFTTSLRRKVARSPAATGSSHRRIEYLRSPKMMTLPTPFTRFRRVAHVDVKVVADEQRVVAIVFSVEACGQHERTGVLVRCNAGRLHFGRQAAKRRRSTVLYVDRSDVEVASQVERRRDIARSVVAAASR